MSVMDAVDHEGLDALRQALVDAARVLASPPSRVVTAAKALAAPRAERDSRAAALRLAARRRT